MEFCAALNRKLASRFDALNDDAQHRIEGEDSHDTMIATLALKRKPTTAQAPHPSGDKRFKILETHMKRFQFKQDALIEVLHKAQELFGFLDEGLLIFIAHGLKLPPSRVYGVATFYHFFKLKPQGEHNCVICMGTACYVKGADKILSTLEENLKIKSGETTPDGKVSLVSARCIGACGIAPAVVYDGVVTPRQSAEDALKKVKGWVGHAS